LNANEALGGGAGYGAGSGGGNHMVGTPGGNGAAGVVYAEWSYQLIATR
jgi:hypothetical protein